MGIILGLGMESMNSHPTLDFRRFHPCEDKQTPSFFVLRTVVCVALL